MASSPMENLQQGVYNAYVMFETSNSETTLGCNSGFYNTNRCDGAPCNSSYNCENCCDYYYLRCYDCGGSDLAWLWWTLSFFFLFCCLISLMASIKRRQRQAALARAMNQHHLHDNATTTTVYYQQQPVAGMPMYQAQPGQPMMGQPMYPGQQPGMVQQPVYMPTYQAQPAPGASVDTAPQPYPDATPNPDGPTLTSKE